MSLSMDSRTFRGLLSDPNAVESLSAVTGCPQVVVEIPDGPAALAMAGLEATALPAVVVVVAPDARCLPADAFRVADVVLTADKTAGRPFTAPPGGVQAGVDALSAALAVSPVAGTARALLLRSSASLTVPAGLVAEPATCSALQAGAEFHRWRSGRTARRAEPGTDQLSARATAHLHGACLGAGIELPAFARRVIAAQDTRFALPELGLGLVPGAGGTVSLTRRIGRWRTACLALTGLSLTAQDALRWGLIDAIQPPGSSR